MRPHPFLTPPRGRTRPETPGQRPASRLRNRPAGTPDPGKQAKRRAVPLLFTDEQGKPIHDQRWSDLWRGWRKAAGWPEEEGRVHSLRHYFATRLITSGADPTDVQNALRHSSLRITLETYVHWWPKKNRRRNIVSTALREAAGNRSGVALPG
ncbi:tyrosine-type recombinase/integrase [Micromonospora sp. B11E3]|uniref:tyrosine-type recombinase/integrase n=1 Tax=Micromonospora sp. B11E3 TaxID=3153562 RepID=UPI00325F6DB0